MNNNADTSIFVGKATKMEVSALLFMKPSN